MIAAIRIGIKGGEHRFKNGGCFQLHMVLKMIWHDAVAWYDGEHVITQIENSYYDIDGPRLLPEKAVRMDEDITLLARAFSWDFE